MRAPGDTDRSGPVEPGTAGWPWGWRLVLFGALTLVFAAGFGLLAGLAWSPAIRPEWWGLVPALAGLLAASWVMMSRVESSSLAALGMRAGRRAGADLLRGTGLGVLLIAIVVAAMAAGGWLHWSEAAGDAGQWTRAAVGFAAFFGLAAFWEELAFRGYPFQVLAEALGPVRAVLLTAAAFAGLHGMNPGIGWLALGNTALAGILLGVLYWRTYSLALVTGTHLGWNWAMSFAADLPVSGLALETPGYDASVGGPLMLTGGSYGPEGGLLLSVVSAAGIAWALKTRRLQRDPGVLSLRPLPERSSRRTLA